MAPSSEYHQLHGGGVLRNHRHEVSGIFAYRLITRETVEEKVLELQATKRDLADAIINEDNSLIRNITGEELLLLLS